MPEPPPRNLEAASEQASVLLRQADRMARIADGLSASFRRELVRVARDLERALARLAADALAAEPEGRQRTLLAKATRAAVLRERLKQAIGAGAYPRLVQAGLAVASEEMTEAVLATSVGDASRRFMGRGDAGILQAFIEIARTDLLQQGDDVAVAVWRSVLSGFYAARPISDVLEDLSDALDVSVRRAGTLYDTYASAVGRQLEQIRSTDRDVFLFAGPADAKTRDWCVERVGKVYSRAAIDAMDNGQLPNVWLTGGGYNCRHTWMSVPPMATDLAALADTGERLPDYTPLVARIPALKAAAKAARSSPRT